MQQAPRFLDASHAVMHRRHLYTKPPSCTKVLRALHRIRRQPFLPPHLQHMADIDVVMKDQREHLLFPSSFIAASLQHMDPRSQERALIIGGNYGYEAALYATLCHEVIVLEKSTSRCSHMQRCFYDNHIRNIKIVHSSADDAGGYNNCAPYDIILMPRIYPHASLPDTIINQCREGARIRHMTAHNSAVLHVYISTMMNGDIHSQNVTQHYLPERHNH